MTTLFDANMIPIIIALLIGIAVGFWMFRRNRVRRAESVESHPVHTSPEVVAAPPPPAPVEQPRRPIRDGIDTVEGRGIADESATAMRDVAGQLLGVDANPDPGTPDNLQMLKGVGPKLAQKLHENGITRFAQLAALSPTEIAMLDERMGAFRGRLERDRVAEQAAYLARGDRDGFEARFGKLGNA